MFVKKLILMPREKQLKALKILTKQLEKKDQQYFKTQDNSLLFFF